MRIGIPAESAEGERRVAATPESIAMVREQGFDVVVASGAGAHASLPDDVFVEAGAAIVTDDEAWGEVDIVAKVREPTLDEIARIRPGATLISFIWPAQHPELVDALAARGVTTLAMDCVPRITRAQKLDARSSMANITGYRAVVEAATVFGSFFTGQFTAAGRVAPATVLVIGAGVAGLAAIGAARGLGASVRAFDVRASVRDQITSLGAEFLEVPLDESGDGQGGYAREMSDAFHAAQMDLFYEQAATVDIVISTALIPGRPAPKLWEARAVQRMKPGSVVVDLAAEQGGNCELTVPGEVVERHGVTIVGYTDLASRMPRVSSRLYGTNIAHLLDDMGGAEGYRVDLDDEVVRGVLVTHGGDITWPPPEPVPAPAPTPVVAAPAPGPPQVAPTAPVADAVPAPADAARSSVPTVLASAVLVGLWLALRFGGFDERVDEALLQHLTVFVLSVFVGWQVIWSVSAALHTPLMSVTNAISGIIIVGGLLQARGSWSDPSVLLGAAAAFFAMINIAGGFLVTRRMLRMFRK